MSGPISRSLPPRTGERGTAASAAGKHITAAVQGGPVEYSKKKGLHFVTITYVASQITAPATVASLLQPILASGGKVTHGDISVGLKGKNLALDVSPTRADTMSLSQRMDRMAEVLKEENIEPSRTIFLSLYSDVSPNLNLRSTMDQVSVSVNTFHVILVYVPNVSRSLQQWLSSPKASSLPVSHLVGGPLKGTRKGGRVVSGSHPGGKGGKAAPVVTKQIVGKKEAGVGREGKGAGASQRGGRGGRAAGRGGAVSIGDGLTKKVSKAGQVIFNRTRAEFRPY